MEKGERREEEKKEGRKEKVTKKGSLCFWQWGKKNNLCENTPRIFLVDL